jgi:hypothetical protein
MTEDYLESTDSRKAWFDAYNKRAISTGENDSSIKVSGYI